MDQRPEQPPEGKLIAGAAGRLDLSIREAARRAGISYGRWRQITAGYQNVSPGVYAAVHAPARTLARMAAVVGVTPEEMETEGQRPDAAEAMRETEAHRGAPVPQINLERGENDVFPDLSPEDRALVDARAPAIADLVYKAALDGPLTGDRIFPASPVEAAALGHAGSDQPGQPPRRDVPVGTDPLDGSRADQGRPAPGREQPARAGPGGFNPHLMMAAPLTPGGAVSAS